jgi:hypothetical protein
MLKVETIRKDTDNHYCKVEVSATEREIAIELTSLLETITEKGHFNSINVALEAYNDWLKALNKKAKESKEDAE